MLQKSAINAEKVYFGTHSIVKHSIAHPLPHRASPAASSAGENPSGGKGGEVVRISLAAF